MQSRSFAVFGIAAAATALLLAGCSTSPSADDGRETLTVAIDSPNLLTTAIADFEKANPDVHIELLPIGSSGYNSVIQTQLASGTAPDVFMVFPGIGEPLMNGTLYERGLVKPLDDDWVADIPSDMLQLFEEPDGSISAVPGTTAAIGITWNDAVLEKLGGLPATTISEVFELCDVANAAGLSLFSVPAKDQWANQILTWALSVQLVYADTPDFNAQLESGGATFAGSAWVDVFELNKRLVDEGCFTEGPTGTGFADARKLLADGAVAATVNYGPSSELYSEAPDGSTFTFTHFPATDDPANVTMPIAASKGFSIWEGTKKLELAERFVEFIASDEGQTAFANDSALVPTLPAPSFVSTQSSQLTLDHMAAGEGRTFPHLDWVQGETAQTVFVEVQNLFLDAITPQELTKKLDTAYQG